MFGNFDENRTRRKRTSLRAGEFDLFREIFRSHNSKEAVMNFVKYTVAQIFAKQIIFLTSQLTGFKMIFHMFAFYEFGSHQNFQVYLCDGTIQTCFT